MTWDKIWSWYLGTPLQITIIVIAALAVNFVARRAINRRIDRLPHDSSSASHARSMTIGVVLRSTCTGTIGTVAVLMVLSKLGVNLAPLIASAGVAGVALGFGAQTMVRDLLAGLFVLIENQYNVGDTVDVGPATGTVERLTLRSTAIRDNEGTLWHVPNGEVRRAGNMSQRWSRAVIDVTVDTDTNIDSVLDTLKSVAKKVGDDTDWSDKLLETPKVLGIQSLTEGGATLRMAVDTEPASQWEVARHIRLEIKLALDKAGVRVASSSDSSDRARAQAKAQPKPSRS